MAGDLTWEDFEKLDLRVGTIRQVATFPKAKKPAYQLTIDFGQDIGLRRSSAQITHRYSPEALEGQQVVAVVNFPPKNIAGFLSECLVLGVYAEDGTVVLLMPKETVGNGLKIG